jgi:photosystem II stability/assembly factor-like uncharacterized protein
MPTYYAALSDRVLVGDGAWTERLAGHDMECVAADPAAPDRAFVGTADAGLQRTTDGGRSWECVLDRGDRVTSVTVSPHDPAVVWAGTEPSAVYRSTDGGSTWERREGLTDLDSATRWSFPPRPHTHHVRWIAVAPDDPEQLYVAIEAGAFVRSHDGGETWRDHPTGARRDNHTLAVHPGAPERVYAAAGDGYARSDDRGDSWTHPQGGLDHRYVWSVAVRPDTVVVSAASGPRSAHSTDGESYVYRTTGADRAAGRDESPRWEVAMDGLPDPEGTVRSVLAAGGGTTLYAANNRGLYRSGNAGASWDRVPVEWPDAYEAETPQGLAVVAE